MGVVGGSPHSRRAGRTTRPEGRSEASAARHRSPQARKPRRAHVSRARVGVAFPAPRCRASGPPPAGAGPQGVPARRWGTGRGSPTVSSHRPGPGVASSPSHTPPLGRRGWRAKPVCLWRIAPRHDDFSLFPLPSPASPWARIRTEARALLMAPPSLLSAGAAPAARCPLSSSGGEGLGRRRRWIWSAWFGHVRKPSGTNCGWGWLLLQLHVAVCFAGYELTRGALGSCPVHLLRSFGFAIAAGRALGLGAPPYVGVRRPSVQISLL
jgi:hypothetical protein